MNRINELNVISNNIKDINTKKNDIKLNINLGIVTFYLKECESIPQEIFQNSSIHTIILHNDKSTYIARRTFEDPVIREYTDPITFKVSRRELDRWSIDMKRHPCKLHPNGIDSNFELFTPII